MHHGVAEADLVCPVPDPAGGSPVGNSQVVVALAQGLVRRYDSRADHKSIHLAHRLEARHEALHRIATGCFILSCILHL